MTLQILNSSKEQTMSSKEIAEYTNKEHFHVMRDIDSFVQSFGNPDLDDLTKHGLTIEAKEEFNVAANRNTRIYYLNKKAALLVTSGYDVHLRLKIINRWEELEAQIQKPLSSAEMIMLQAQWNLEQEKKLLAVEKTVENQEIKLTDFNKNITEISREVEDVKSIVVESLIPLEEICSDKNAFFEISEVATTLISNGYFKKEKDFRLYLLDQKICYKKGDNNYHPMSIFVKSGYLNSLIVKKGNRTFMATHFTPKGVVWIINKIKQGLVA